MTPSKGCTSEYSDELVLNKEKLWYPDLCRVKGLPCCCSSSTTHCPQYDDQEPGLGRRISLLPLAFLPLPTNSLSRKCELWRNFSNIFHSENVFPLSLSLRSCEWQCSRKTAFLHFVRYGEFMEMSSGSGGSLLFTPMHQLQLQGAQQYKFIPWRLREFSLVAPSLRFSKPLQEISASQ